MLGSELDVKYSLGLTLGEPSSEVLRVITFNCNGVRATARKGFFDWLAHANADVVCLQETKAQECQLADPIFRPRGYHCFYFDAEKKGYAGTALFSRKKPLKIIRGTGFPITDTEGRYIQADFSGLSIASLYLPSGSSGPERQERKLAFMNHFEDHMRCLLRKHREYIICADWNICHRQIDLRNWRSNQNHSGFLPEERAWLDNLFDEVGWSDAFRLVNQEADQYSWWSNRGQARAKNVGWRLDYQLVTPGLRSLVLGAEIYTAQNFSDHAPVIIDYADTAGKKHRN